MSRNNLEEPEAKKSVYIGEDEYDEYFKQAVGVVCQYDRASASLIQRRLNIGYARSARILDQLYAAGVVGAAEGSSPREVLIHNPEDILGKVAEKPEKEEKKDLQESNVPYKKPSLNVIKKSSDTKWKKTLFDAVNDKKFERSGDSVIPLGYTEDNQLLVRKLEELNHLIVGGNGISNKEVMLDTFLVSLLLNEPPHKLKLILVDPVRYLNYYENLPHLLTPVINEHEKLISALRWLQAEMDRRLKYFAQAGKRDFASFNESILSKDYSITSYTTELELPRILLVINQFEDLMLYSPVEVEDAMARILKSAHKVGIHIVFTTNHLTTKFIPSSVLSEMPNRLLFRFTSYSDAGKQSISEVEQLGDGEAIFISTEKPQKLNALYTSEENVKEVVKSIV